MSRGARKTVVAAAVATAFAGGVVASLPSATVRHDRMCTQQPSDGGVCIYLEANHGAHLVRFAPGVRFPTERALGQCSEPSPCPREP
jgi:hypothetical protein